MACGFNNEPEVLFHELRVQRSEFVLVWVQICYGLEVSYILSIATVNQGKKRVWCLASKNLDTHFLSCSSFSVTQITLQSTLRETDSLKHCRLLDDLKEGGFTPSS